LGNREDLHAVASSSDWCEGCRRISKRWVSGSIRQRRGGRVIASRCQAHRHADHSLEGVADTPRKRDFVIMAVRIEKTFEVAEPVDQVWTLLSDPRKVVACVPGAKITEAVDDRTYKGAISVKVGPSVNEFKGEVHIDRLDEETHILELSGKG